MQGLSGDDLITILTGLVTLLGVMWAAGRTMGKLEPKISESLRQLSAMHKRMDSFSMSISDLKVEQAVLKERVSNLRNTQRFKVSGTEVPLFKDQEVEG